MTPSDYELARFTQALIDAGHTPKRDAKGDVDVNAFGAGTPHHGAICTTCRDAYCLPCEIAAGYQIRPCAADARTWDDPSAMWVYMALTDRLSNAKPSPVDERSMRTTLDKLRAKHQIIDLVR